MIQVEKIIDNDYNKEWEVIDTTTFKVAKIVAIHDYFMGMHRNTGQYRVDYKGYTVNTCIDHFQTAKSIAIKCVRGEK